LCPITFTYFVGVDLEQHAVVVVNAAGEILGRHSVAHNGSEVLELFAWVAKLTRSPSLNVSPSPPKPRTAPSWNQHWSAGMRCSINPKQLSRFCDRFSVAGAKNDDRDGLVLASSMRPMLLTSADSVLGDPGAARLKLPRLGRISWPTTAFTRFSAAPVASTANPTATPPGSARFRHSLGRVGAAATATVRPVL